MKRAIRGSTSVSIPRSSLSDIGLQPSRRRGTVAAAAAPPGAPCQSAAWSAKVFNRQRRIPATRQTLSARVSGCPMKPTQEGADNGRLRSIRRIAKPPSPSAGQPSPRDSARDGDSSPERLSQKAAKCPESSPRGSARDRDSSPKRPLPRGRGAPEFLSLRQNSLNGLLWRRDRDSNPGASLPANGFQDRRLRPLGHPSIRMLRRRRLDHLDPAHVGS